MKERKVQHICYSSKLFITGNKENRNYGVTLNCFTKEFRLQMEVPVRAPCQAATDKEFKNSVSSRTLSNFVDS